MPYAGTAAILIILYFRLRNRFVPDEFFDALRRANIALLLAGTVLPFFIYFLTNVIYASRVFTWFVKPLKVSEIVAVRGATLLLNIINPAVAGGAWMVYLMRKNGASMVRVIAMGGLNFAAVLTWVHTITTAVLLLMWTGHFQVSEKLRNGLTIYTIFGWLWFLQTITFWLLGWKWGPLNIIREWQIMEVFRRARLRHWLIAGALSLPTVYGTFIGQYLCARAFGIVMPFTVFIGKWLVVIPYLLIPSVGGAGPLTMGWLKAYQGNAAPEALIACTAAAITIGHITRTLLGLICLLPATREIAGLNKREDQREEGVRL